MVQTDDAACQRPVVPEPTERVDLSDVRCVIDLRIDLR